MEDNFWLEDLLNQVKKTKMVVLLDEEATGSLRKFEDRFEKLKVPLFLSNKMGSPYFRGKLGFSLVLGAALSQSKETFLITTEESELFLLENQNLANFTMIEKDFIDSNIDKLSKFEQSDSLKDVIAKPKTKKETDLVLKSKSFDKTVISLWNYMVKKQPRTFSELFKLIADKSRMMSNHINKENKSDLDERELSFHIFTELLERKMLKNEKIRQLIREKVFTKIDDIQAVLVGIEVEAEDKRPENHPSRQFNPIKFMSKTIEDQIVAKFDSYCSSSQYFNEYAFQLRTLLLSKLTLDNLNNLPSSLSALKNYCASAVNPKIVTQFTRNIASNENYYDILVSGILFNFRILEFISVENTKVTYNISNIKDN